MTGARIEFETELETFRKEVDTASQLLYTHFTVRDVAANKPSILHALNRHPYFWATTMYALQCSGFVALGRIFDQRSPHNVDTVLRLAQRHAVLFTRDELAKRKREGSANAYKWLPNYMMDVYVPIPNDFRRLRKKVAKRRTYIRRHMTGFGTGSLLTMKSPIPPQWQNYSRKSKFAPFSNFSSS